MSVQHAADRMRRRSLWLQHGVEGEAVDQRVYVLDGELGVGEFERGQRLAHKLAQPRIDALAERSQRGVDAGAGDEREPDLRLALALIVKREQLREHARGRCKRRCGGRERRDAAREALAQRRHRKREKLSLRREHVAQRARRQPGLPRDAANRDRVKTRALNDPPRGLGDVAPTGVRINEARHPHVSSTTVLTS